MELLQGAQESHEEMGSLLLGAMGNGRGLDLLFPTW